MRRAVVLAIGLTFVTPCRGEQTFAVERVASAGYSIRDARVERDGDGVRVVGAVCRRGFSTARPRFVRVDAIDARGAIIATSAEAVRAPPGYRGGCAAYAAAAPEFGPGARLRVSVSRSR